MKKGNKASETAILEKEDNLRAWFTQECDPVRKVVDGLDIGWGGVQRWATGRISIPATGRPGFLPDNGQLDSPTRRLWKATLRTQNIISAPECRWNLIWNVLDFFFPV